MSSKKNIPIYSDFNSSLRHLHLEEVDSKKLFYITKWEYKENFKIIYPLSRQNYYDITFFIEADFTHHLDTESFSLKNNSLHLITPGQAEHFETESLARPKGYAIYFYPEFLFGDFPQQKLFTELTFLRKENNNVFELSAQQSIEMQSLFQTMLIEQKNIQDHYAILKHYLLIILYKLKQIGTKDVAKEIQYAQTNKKIASAFQTLVSKNFLNNTSIEGYADILIITPKHLSEIVKLELGKTPKQIIQETLLLEAKLLLRHSTMNISEITFHLNFHDVSHFTKFFKNQTSTSPSQFRKKI